MSFRSPTPDGLAISPNAAAFGGNPAASPQELQSHHYWGRFQLTTQLPNVGFIDGVAVVGTNPASAPAYNKLAPGDLGFVEGAAAPSVSNLYVCVDRGTLGGNDARWLSLSNASTVVQTIRDAHVMVVAQDSWLAGLGGGAIPPNAANNFNLSAAGDVVSITCDYLDPGDGSQLTLAMSAAAAGGIFVDIRLRPMELNLTAATAPIALPNGMRLLGAGPGISSIIGRDQGNQSVLDIGDDATVEDMTITSPAPVAATAGGTAVVALGTDAKIRRCNITMAGNGGGGTNRTIRYAVQCLQPDGYELVDDCALFVDSLANQATPALSVGISFGQTTASVPETYFEAEVRNTTIQPAVGGLGSCPIGVEFLNTSGGRCFNVEHNEVNQPQGAFRWLWSFTPGAAVTTPVRGPKFIECRVSALDSEAVGVGQDAFFVAVSGTPNLAAGITDPTFEDCVAFFLPAGNPLGIERTGFRVANGASDGSNMRSVSFVACRSELSHKGFLIDASGGTNGRIDGAKLTGCFAPAQTTAVGITPCGLLVRGSASAPPNETVRAVGAQNCDFRDAPATGYGVRLEDVGVIDSIILGNSLTPNGGTALSDAATGTEAAHNIV